MELSKFCTHGRFDKQEDHAELFWFCLIFFKVLEFSNFKARGFRHELSACWQQNGPSIFKPERNIDMKTLEPKFHRHCSVSYHARQRMREMGLCWDEVSSVVADPDVEYPGRRGRDGRPARVAVGGRLAVVTSADGGAVVTVLWRGAEGRVAA